MITAEEFFRQKIQDGHPIQLVVTLSTVLITAEQGIRWAKEYSDYVTETLNSNTQEATEEIEKETLEELAEIFVNNRFAKQICGDKTYPDIYASKEAIIESHILFAKSQQETYKQFTLAMDDLKSSSEGYLKAKKEYELKQQEISFSEEQVELIANEMVNWAIDNIGNPNPESGKKFDEVLAKYKTNKN